MTKTRSDESRSANGAESSIFEFWTHNFQHLRQSIIERAMKSSIAAVFLTSLAAATHSQGKEVSFYTIIRNDHPKAPMQNKENTKTLLSHFLLRCISKRSNPTFASCKILGPLISEEMDASIITPTIRIGSHSSTKTITMFKLLWGFHSPLVTRPLPMS